MEILAFIIGSIGFIFLILDFSLYILFHLSEKIFDNFIDWIAHILFLENEDIFQEFFYFITIFTPFIFFFLSPVGIFLAFLSYKFMEKKFAKIIIYLNIIDLLLSLIGGLITIIGLSKAAW